METLFSTLYYGNTIGQWAFAIGTIVGAVVIARALYWISGRFLKQLTRRTRSEIDDVLIDKAEEPFTAAVVLIGINIGLGFLAIPEGGAQLIENGSRLFWAVLVAWLVMRVYAAFHETYLVAWAHKSTNDFDDHILPIIKSGVNVTVMLLGVVIGLNNAGYDVTSVLAGLGIGGLAFALAAQDTISNIFGGLIILTQRPFKIGDVIVVNDQWMIVKQIGLRSSVMTDCFHGHRLYIPNSSFTSSTITNVSEFPGHSIYSAVKLSPLSSSAQLAQAIELINAAMAATPQMAFNPNNTRLDSFDETGFTFKYSFTCDSFNVRGAVLNSVNIGIVRALEDHKIPLALPMYASLTEVVERFPAQALRGTPLPASSHYELPQPALNGAHGAHLAAD